MSIFQFHLLISFQTFESYVIHGYATSGLNDVDISKYVMVLPANQCFFEHCAGLLTVNSSIKRDLGNNDFTEVFKSNGAIVCFLKSPIQPAFAAGRTMFVQTNKTGLSHVTFYCRFDN